MDIYSVNLGRASVSQNLFKTYVFMSGTAVCANSLHINYTDIEYLHCVRSQHKQTETIFLGDAPR